MGVYCRKMDFFSSSLPFRLLRTLVSNWWTTDKKSNVTIFAVPWNMRSLKVTRKKTPLSLWLFAVSFLLNRSWSIVARRKLRQCKGVFCDVRAFYCDRMRWLHFYTLFIFTNEMRFFFQPHSFWVLLGSLYGWTVQWIPKWSKARAFQPLSSFSWRQLIAEPLAK